MFQIRQELLKILYKYVDKIYNGVYLNLGP